MTEFEEYCKSRYESEKEEYITNTLDQYPSKDACIKDFVADYGEEKDWIKNNLMDLDADFREEKRMSAGEFAWECATDR